MISDDKIFVGVSPSATTNADDTLMNYYNTFDNTAADYTNQLTQGGPDEATEVAALKCNAGNMFISNCDKLLLKKEFKEHTLLEEGDKAVPDYIYPLLDDPNFNVKIALKKEFNDTQYDGTIHQDVKKQADLLSKQDFELQPHQAFVKNFLSPNTPYNSLLLMHGVGTGKTCTAIGVTEELRDMMRQTGEIKKIFIIASENVHDNFKLQLFDERKLRQLEDGQWTISSCTGNKLLQEINPTNMQGLTVEKIATQIRNIINTYYEFMGYSQFANHIRRLITGIADNKNRKDTLGDLEITPAAVRLLHAEFADRMIVIDEVHNIRKSEDNDKKKVAFYLDILVKHVQKMKLLLLTATPMFNSYKEIVWLLNIMNMNDGRGRIRISDVFNPDGTFKGEEGRALFIRKATGYVSYIRGENPYTFPYRVYPALFDRGHTFAVVPYPAYQMNLRRIRSADKKRVLDLYLNFVDRCAGCGGGCQACCYQYIIEHLRQSTRTNVTKKGVVRVMPSFENMESFGYSILQIPLESLIISYPIEGLEDLLEDIARRGEYSDREPEESFSSMSASAVGDDDDGLDMEITNYNTVEDAVTDKEEDAEEEEEDTQQGGKKSASMATSAKLSMSTALKSIFTIHPNTLTGKGGLDRMMDTHKIMRGGSTMGGGSKGDQRTVYEILFGGGGGGNKKGGGIADQEQQYTVQYDYKPATLRQFGRIFAQDRIAKYSKKIHTILDLIKRSTGIILVYSQYIEGGLIPMALALEEMGFIRYSANNTTGAANLLAHKDGLPAVVDVRTMQPQAGGDFMPAQYVMITGNTKFSPDNMFDVKGLTSDNNKDGNIIKVVLISKSGSESIDMKNIRQVHILEPWYNMNRIEQVIGRGVRNFSHKLLPFEDHNVEIFMHGTIITDTDEEAADLYVYRVAEYKAVHQIGPISRILKETSVDCILNHEQTNFTQEVMQPVTQRLSTGQVLYDFKIGDAPYSSICDYMNTCAYSCTPGGPKNIDPASLNLDTYNENFIYLNTDKIAQKVRLLMRMAYFYTKTAFIRAIQDPKPYPLIQIYATLTRLIEDKNEQILDRYGRTGYLQNVGNYYLFLPQELATSGATATVFDRSRPIDWKNSVIQFKSTNAVVTYLSEDDDAAVETATQETVRDASTTRKTDARKNNYKLGERLFLRLRGFYDIVMYEMEHGVADEDDLDDEDNELEEEMWYRQCGKMLGRMVRDFDTNATKLRVCVVGHLLDMIVEYADIMAFLNYVYQLTDMGEFGHHVWDYYEAKLVTLTAPPGLRVMMLYNYSQGVQLFVTPNGVERDGTMIMQWDKVQPDDIVEYDIVRHMNEAMNARMQKQDYKDIVGFIGYVQKSNILAFKVINLTAKRDIGYLCVQAGKKKLIDVINEALGVDYFNKDNTKQIKKDGVIVQSLLQPRDLCIIHEFLLRYYDLILRDNKKWFVDPVVALCAGLYKIYL